MYQEVDQLHKELLDSKGVDELFTESLEEEDELFTESLEEEELSVEEDEVEKKQVKEQIEDEDPSAMYNLKTTRTQKLSQTKKFSDRKLDLLRSQTKKFSDKKLNLWRS